MERGGGVYERRVASDKAGENRGFTIGNSADRIPGNRHLPSQLEPRGNKDLVTERNRNAAKEKNRECLEPEK